MILLIFILSIQTTNYHQCLSSLSFNKANDSSFQALDKPAPVRISSLLTSRHLSQRRIRLPVRKYHSKNDGPKASICSSIFNLGFWLVWAWSFMELNLVCLNYCVLLQVAFFSDDEDTPTTPKADALFIPRENPRALIICPVEQWPGKASEKASTFKDRSIPVNENGKIFLLIVCSVLSYSYSSCRNRVFIQYVG